MAEIERVCRRRYFTMIRKAVIPAAGRGRRLAPATTIAPKELLPVGGSPMIRLCVEEAVRSGMTEICVVVSPGKRGIERVLAGEGTPPARADRDDREHRLTFLVQEEPAGVGDAIGLAREFVGDEPFALMLPDNVSFCNPPAVSQIEETFERYGKETFAVVRIPPALAPSFSASGLISCEARGGRALRITSFAPKRRGYCGRRAEPLVKTVARAILLPRFFDVLDQIRGGIRGEVDDGPVFREIIRRDCLMGHLVDGHVFDCGNPRGYAAANAWAVAHGLS